MNADSHTVCSSVGMPPSRWRRASSLWRRTSGALEWCFTSSSPTAKRTPAHRQWVLTHTRTHVLAFSLPVQLYLWTLLFSSSFFTLGISGLRPLIQKSSLIHAQRQQISDTIKHNLNHGISKCARFLTRASASLPFSSLSRWPISISLLVFCFIFVLIVASGVHVHDGERQARTADRLSPHWAPQVGQQAASTSGLSHGGRSFHCSFLSYSIHIFTLVLFCTLFYFSSVVLI